MLNRDLKTDVLPRSSGGELEPALATQHRIGRGSSLLMLSEDATHERTAARADYFETRTRRDEPPRFKVNPALAT